MSQSDKKLKKFILPTSLKSLHQSKKNQTHEFIKRLQSSKPKEDYTKNIKNKQSSLFKLNPSSKALVQEFSIQLLRQKSKSLQSLHGQKKQVFNLFDHQKQIDGKILKQKRYAQKKYDINIKSFSDRIDKVDENNQINQQQKERYNIVKPSQTYKIKSQLQNSHIFNPTIIQTPILPVFASQFHPNLAKTESKKIEIGQGTWKIGKIKIKKNKCQLVLNQFVFQSCQVQVKGGAGLLKENQLHLLPIWNKMMVFQPQENLFLG